MNKAVKFRHAILGGTFDHLHAGHNHFISSAIKVSEKVTIGLTADGFSRHKLFHYSIESYQEREENLKGYLGGLGCLGRAKIILIKDNYGTSLVDDSIDAIFVTGHGIKNAKIINQKRLENGLAPLSINKVDYLKGVDNQIISSTKIRKGEIDRMGTPYKNIFVKTLTMPKGLKSGIQILPGGKVFKTLNDYKKSSIRTFVIAVGDIISERLLENNIPANVAVIDFRTGRVPLYPSLQLSPLGRERITEKTENVAGEINKNVVEVIEKSINKSLKYRTNELVVIDGEEDLLALPAILLAPLESDALYGLPGEGFVVVGVTEGVKEEIRELVRKFS